MEGEEVNNNQNQEQQCEKIQLNNKTNQNIQQVQEKDINLDKEEIKQDNIQQNQQNIQQNSSSKDNKNSDISISNYQSTQNSSPSQLKINDKQKSEPNQELPNMELKKVKSHQIPPTVKSGQKTGSQSFGKNQARTPQEKQKISIKSFEIISVLGQGAFGEVLRVKKKDNQQEYAIKMVDKQFLAREKKQYQVYMERGVLMHLNHVGLVKLHFSFQVGLCIVSFIFHLQDSQYLYFGLDYVGGGDFSHYMKLNFKNLVKSTIQFYIAEIIIILEYLHSKGIVHRDLKPENIILTNSRHIKLIDFGTASIYDNNLCPQKIKEAYVSSKQKKDQTQDPDDFTRERKATLVGTAEYVSPELLEDETCDNSADIWALGIILYKMYQGKTPFYGQTEYLIFENIKQGNLKYPSNMDEDAIDLLDQWLIRDPTKRLGAGAKGEKNDFIALKNHKFFKGINWENLFQQDAPEREIFSPIKSSNNLDEYKYLQVSTQNSPFPKSENSINFQTPKTVQQKQQKPQENSNQKDKILKTGKFKKKVANVLFNFYHKKQLILFQNPPKLLYFDLDNKDIKTEILINQQTKIELINENKFIIIDQQKEYLFKKMEDKVEPWVEILKQLQQESCNLPQQQQQQIQIKKNSIDINSPLNSQNNIVNQQQTKFSNAPNISKSQNNLDQVKETSGETNSPIYDKKNSSIQSENNLKLPNKSQ